ncbi:Cysteine-rich receptor-like protein kinase 29 [Raphanus sativus]|nr:Cysteine-rich receptor-like protein kinase 29 [Raphanus sativus]
MEHVRLIVFFACFLMFVPLKALAQADTYQFAPRFRCLDRGNFTANSTFAGNLNRLVSSLSSVTSPEAYGFYNLSSGSLSGERAYAIGLCRREVRRDDCLSCIQRAARNLTEQCPQTKQAVVWYTRCMFRYSNMTLYGKKETFPTLHFIAGQTIPSNEDEFKRLRRGLLDRLKGIAAAGGPNRKYAQGNGSGTSGYRTFYGSAQCSPDLSEKDCDDCLVFGFGQIPLCCDDQIGLRWFCPSCNFRFEKSRFFELDADLEPDPPATKTERTGYKVVIAIVVPIVLVASFAIWLCYVLKWKKNKSRDRVEGKYLNIVGKE